MEIMSPSNLCESLIPPDEMVPRSKCGDSASRWLIFLLRALSMLYILLNNYSADKLKLTNRIGYKCILKKPYNPQTQRKAANNPENHGLSFTDLKR